jgi:hypothetical protein
VEEMERHPRLFGLAKVPTRMGRVMRLAVVPVWSCWYTPPSATHML